MDDTKSIKRNFNSLAPIAACVFVVAAVVIVGFLIRQAFTKSVNDSEKQIAKQGGANQKVGENQPEAKRVDPLVLDEQRLMINLRLEGIRDVQREIDKLLERLEQETTVLDTRLPELLKGDDGKRIAASRTRAEQFATVLERNRISVPRVRKLRERLDSMIKLIDRAIMEPTSSYSASESLVSEVEKIGDETRAGLRDARDIRVRIETLHADSKAVAPAEKSLQTVLDEMYSEQVRHRMQALAKAKQDEFERETKRLAEDEAKAQREIAAARRARLNAETEAEVQKISQKAEEQIRQMKADAEAERKRVARAERETKFDAEYPAIKDYLVPITSSGFKQFEGDWLKMSSTKGPMSFAGLKAHLTKSESASFHFARNIYDQNDRPKGAFPYLSTGGAGQTPQNFAILYRIQDFLAEFGDIMVERKFLAP